MKAKMLSRKLAILVVLGLFILYLIANKDVFITEYLTNPTVGSLEIELKNTNSKLSKLNSEFQDLKGKASAQASEAAAAKAAISNTL